MHKKLVDKKSLEANFYSFDRSKSAVPVGDIWTFMHKVFYCPHCKKTIEYVTQTNLEDIDIIMRKVKNAYSKFSKIKPVKITTRKRFEKYDGSIVDKIDNIEEITRLHMIFEVINKPPITRTFPIYRENMWERPYRFDVKKKDVIWWKRIYFLSNDTKD